MCCVNSISVVTRIISSSWFLGLQETKHFGNNNTSYVDAYDDIQLEFNMADVRRELGTIERIRWPILGTISNGDILYGSLGTIKGIRWPGWMDYIICDKASTKLEVLSFFYRWNYYFLKLL